MLGYSGDSSDCVRSRIGCHVPQFDQCVFIGTVAIDAEEDRFRSVSIDGGETSDSSHRHTAAVGWDCNDSEIISCKADCGKIGAAVWQGYDKTL